MATREGGFSVGDKVTPQDFNCWATKGEVCEVIQTEEWSMKIRRSSGATEWVHPYRWRRSDDGGTPNEDPWLCT